MRIVVTPMMRSESTKGVCRVEGCLEGGYRGGRGCAGSYFGARGAELASDAMRYVDGYGRQSEGYARHTQKAGGRHVAREAVEGGRGAGADAALSDRGHGGRAGGPRSPSFTKSAGQCDAAVVIGCVGDTTVAMRCCVLWCRGLQTKKTRQAVLLLSFGGTPQQKRRWSDS